MNWPLSLLVGLINALLAGAGAMAVASLGVSWHRVSSREGAAGFFVIGMTLLGFIVGGILGLVVARFVASNPDATFLKGLGCAVGTSAGILAFITALSWLNADFAPKHAGKYMELEVEVLCPQNWGQPQSKRGTSHYVTLTADYGPRRQTSGMIDLSKGVFVDGRWKVTSFVGLQTSYEGKTLGVVINDKGQYVRPSIPARPTEKDFGWSAWMSDTTTGSLETLPPDQRVSLRYRLGYDQSEVREAAREQEEKRALEAEQRAFENLSPDAPLEVWLPHVDWKHDYSRRSVAIQKMVARPEFVRELKAVLLSKDREMVGRALTVIDGLTPPPKDFGPVLEDIASQIAGEVEEIKGHLDQEGAYDRAQDLEAFLGRWAGAACALHEQAGYNLIPAVQKIAAAAAHESYILGSLQGTASVYLQRWGVRQEEPEPAAPQA